MQRDLMVAAQAQLLQRDRGASTAPTIVMTSTPSAPSLSQLKWMCRRGMRELDELLSRYLEQRYDTADNDEKAAFQALLELPDPDLVGYLLNLRQPASERIANVVNDILGRDSSA